MIKKNISLALILLLGVMSVFSQNEKTSFSTQGRERLLMDFGWRFALGHATDYAKDFTTGTSYFTYFSKTGYGDGAAAAQFKDSTWREVDLPHDWAVELPFSGEASHSHGYKTIGYKYSETSVGWYRKKFTVPASDLGRKISIQFDGVHRNATVWVNGFYVGNEPSGYATSVYDITDYLNYGGENTVAVRVDASIEEGWYYEGAGIYRHVWLNKSDRLHVAQFGTFVTTELNGNNAELTVRTKVQNQHDKLSVFTIEQCLMDANNQQVLSGKLENVSLNGNVDKTYFQKINVEKPTLWSLENPYLYKLKTNIIAEGKIVDSYTTNVGIRTVRFDPNQGFFLNGKSVKIVGTNMHQDHAGVGTAIPDALQEFRIKKLKEMGNNGIRTSHNPATPEMLDACDRLGMLVLDENRLMGINQEHFDLMERFMVRDRNHPSVVLWSVGNEEWAIESNEKGARITKTMQEFAQKIDSSRAFTVAISGGWENGSGKTTQVMGYNYIVQGNIDEHHKNFPRQSGIGTEESNTIGTRGIYVDDKANGRMAASNRMPENVGTESGWKFYAARPFLSGLFFWTGFDYRGEANPLVWPAVNSQFGIVDLCGFPKDIFYYLKSWWGKQPVMHIMPHWNWKGSEGKNIKVTIYSNAEEVELVLNKKSLGKKTMEKNGHLEWDVTYQPGTLVAKGFVNGKQTVSEQVETTGAPAKVALLGDRSQLNADGEDVAVITVQLNDLKNRWVPTANKEIIFTLGGQGKIIGVGNGDPASHAPEQFVATASSPTPQWKRDTFNGLAQIIVKTTKQAGEITLTASSDGLTPATLKLTTTTLVLRPTTEIIKK
jgi:beta-galactosidase